MSFFSPLFIFIIFFTISPHLSFSSDCSNNFRSKNSSSQEVVRAEITDSSYHNFMNYGQGVLDIVDRKNGDRERGLNRIKEAANKDFPNAQYELALYQQSNGSYKMANLLLESAAQQGHIPAIYDLIPSYNIGHNIRQNKTRAYMWALVVKDLGLAESIKKHLNKKQILEGNTKAEKMSSKILKINPNFYNFRT